MTVLFQAQSPYVFEGSWPKSLEPSTPSKVAQVFWKVVSVVAFPIRAIESWVRERVFRIIVPGSIAIDAPMNNFFDEMKLIFRFLYNSENFKADTTQQGRDLIKTHQGESVQLKAPDGALLDGAFFPGKNRKKAIIYAFGNAEQWENQTHMIGKLKDFNTSILMINPRGVGKSKGARSEQGYTLDAYTAYRYLIERENLDPEDILLVGFSMGAAYGTCGASLIQEEYPDKKLNAINICSFSDLALTADTILSEKGVFAWFARIGARLFNLRLNPKAGWDKLKGKKCIFYRSKDPVIPEPSSLLQAIKDNPVGKTQVVELHPHRHIPPYEENEVTSLNNQILDMLNLDLKQTSLHRPSFFSFFSHKPYRI